MRTGEVIDGIVKSAKEHKADLIVLATDGRNGFLDGLRGSHSERILRYGVAPLLTILSALASLVFLVKPQKARNLFVTLCLFVVTVHRVSHF